MEEEDAKEEVFMLTKNDVESQIQGTHKNEELDVDGSVRASRRAPLGFLFPSSIPVHRSAISFIRSIRFDLFLTSPLFLVRLCLYCTDNR